jgi:hypothetical protein
MQMAGSTRLGPKRELTREGYLICRDVPMGRTGEMIYAKGSIRDDKGNEAVEADERGLIVVNRSADVLFHPDTLASAFGKPATIIHPAGNLVRPENYAAVAKGVISNPRRGRGSQDDMLLGDITFYDRNAIDAIQRGDFGPNPEVSLGADSGFIQVRPGYAEAAWIRINHVAVVPKGRCGPRCAIGDGEDPMTIKELLARARAAFTAGNTADGEAALAEAETLSAATADADDPNAALLARLDAIEARLPAEGSTGHTITLDGAEMAETIRNVIREESAPLIARIEAFEAAARTADEAEQARLAAATTADEAMIAIYPAARIQDVTASAEILAPGFKPAQPLVAGTTADCAHAMCGCQRGALAASYATADGKAAIDKVLAGRSADFASMDAITVDTIFNAAAAIRAAENNATKGQRGAPNGYQPPMSPNDRLKAGIARVNAG